MITKNEIRASQYSGGKSMKTFKQTLSILLSLILILSAFTVLPVSAAAADDAAPVGLHRDRRRKRLFESGLFQPRRRQHRHKMVQQHHFVGQRRLLDRVFRGNGDCAARLLSRHGQRHQQVSGSQSHVLDAEGAAKRIRQLDGSCRRHGRRHGHGKSDVL